MKSKIWRSFGYCEVHQKHFYVDRKTAKQVCRMHQGEHKGPFRCDENPDLWHIGGLSRSVIAGKYGRSQVYDNVA